MVRHGKHQRGLGYIIDLVAAVRRVARRGFAALLGTDAGDDQPLDTMFHQPNTKAAANQCTVPVFLKDYVRCYGNLGQRFHMAGCGREDSVFLHMKYLQDGDAILLGPIDQGLEAVKKTAWLPGPSSTGADEKTLAHQ